VQALALGELSRKPRAKEGEREKWKIALKKKVTKKNMSTELTLTVLKGGARQIIVTLLKWGRMSK